MYDIRGYLICCYDMAFVRVSVLDRSYYRSCLATGLDLLVIKDMQ